MFQYIDHLIAWRYCYTLNRRIKFDMKFNQPSDPATITRSFASKMRCWFLFILSSFIKLAWLKWHKPRTHSADIAQLCLCYLFANGQTGIKQWSISHLRGRLYFMLDFSEWFSFCFVSTITPLCIAIKAIGNGKTSKAKWYIRCLWFVMHGEKEIWHDSLAHLL